MSDQSEVYSEETRDFLVSRGLKWFAENPCQTADDLSTLIEYGLDGDKFKAALNKSKKAIEANVLRYTVDTNPQPDLHNSNSELRCVLFGKTGEGKSSFGNLLLGANKFKVFRGAATGTNTIEYSSSDEYNIKIIDTPGFADPNKMDMKLEAAKIFHFFAEGIHAFIVVIDLANPRITNDDLQTFQKLKEIFGVNVLDHVFLVFTKADTYLREDSHNLGEYLKELLDFAENKAIVSDYFNTIGDRMIAVENECRGYKRSLIRRAVLSLIRNSSPECYTVKYFKDTQEEIEKHLTTKSENRRQQMQNLEKEIEQEVCNFLTEKGLRYVMKLQKPGNIELTQLTQISSKVKTSVEGLDDIERPYVVGTKVKGVLQTQIPQFLKESFEKLVAQNVPNPKESTQEMYSQMQRKEPDLVDFLGQDFVTHTIELRIDKVKRECALAFISENLYLRGDPSQIQAKLIELHGGSFKGEDARQLITECLESEDVQWAYKRRMRADRQRIRAQESHGRISSLLFHEGWQQYSRRPPELCYQLSNIEGREMNHVTVESRRRVGRNIVPASMPPLSPYPSSIYVPHLVPKSESREYRQPSQGHELEPLRRRLEVIETENMTRLQLKDETVEDKVKRECALAFISENLYLRGDPSQIQAKLIELHGGSFKGEDARQLITECLESEDVQWACERRRTADRQIRAQEPFCSLCDEDRQLYSHRPRLLRTQSSNIEGREMNHVTVDSRRRVDRNFPAFLSSPVSQSQYRVPMGESREMRDEWHQMREDMNHQLGIETENVTKHQLKDDTEKRERDRRKRASTTVIRSAKNHVGTLLATKTRTESIQFKTVQTKRSKMFEQVTRDVRADVGEEIIEILSRDEISYLVKDVLDATVNEITDPSLLEKCRILVTSIFGLSLFKKALGLQ